MIKIAHEAPLDIFDEVQRFTDYDYALVHLLEENPRYRDTFERAIKKGREVILDNSIFELEEAFEAERFAQWVNRLKASWYIIPDALENMALTIGQCQDFKRDYPRLHGKSIGVVQGKDYEEIKRCYQFMDMHSGGGTKVPPYENIYIDAYTELEAVEIFRNKLGRDPHDVTCECCGSDYSISEARDIFQATGHSRQCAYDVNTRDYIDKPGTYYKEFISIENYLKRKDVLYIEKGIIPLYDK